MNEESGTTRLPKARTGSRTVEDEVRAAFTERIRAEMARFLADSLAAREAATGGTPVPRPSREQLRREAAAHDHEAERHEQRVVKLRQLEHDGRLKTGPT